MTYVSVLLLVGAAVLLVRRRPARGGVGWKTGPMLPALPAAAAVLAVTAGIVLAAGL